MKYLICCLFTIAAAAAQAADCPGGGYFLGAGAESVKVGDAHSSLPVYGLTLTASDQCATAFGLLHNVGVQLGVEAASGTVGEHKYAATEFSLGPRMCHYVATGTGLCVAISASVLRLHYAEAYALGAPKLDLAIEQRLYKEVTGAVSLRVADYKTGGKDSQPVNTSSLLISLGWSPSR